MAYVATGTAGNDTLNQSTDTGPGTIVGLAGDDTISLGSGPAQVFGNSGNDSVLLQTGNTGTVNGGTENDSIFGPAGTGSMQLFGSDGADTVDVQSTGGQTVVGGNDSSDGADTIITGGGADFIFGNGGNDTINAAGGNDTLVSGFGNDSVVGAAGNELFFGNQGNDTVDLAAGADTGFGGLGNDSLIWAGAGSPVLFGNEGGDTMDAAGGTPTLVGGNDSADGNDSFGGGVVTAFVLGNGGNDSFNIGSSGGVTEVGGFGNDCMFFGNGAERSLLFGNEGNDNIGAFSGLTGATTVFGGQGNDTIITALGRDTIQGNEGNDTIQGDSGLIGGISIDTISGGSGNDVFSYLGAGTGGQDGNNAAGGGPVEQITDLDWSADKFDTQVNVTFAANMGAGTGGDLNASANNAVAAAFALGGSGAAQVTAAQFTFSGRTYLVIEQTAGTGVFDDATDLLIDITGATGAIGNEQLHLVRVPLVPRQRRRRAPPAAFFRLRGAIRTRACSFRRRYGWLLRRMNGCSFGRRQLHEKQGRKPPDRLPRMAHRATLTSLGGGRSGGRPATTRTIHRGSRMPWRDQRRSSIWLTWPPALPAMMS